jgi:hypothetical protein
MNRIPSPVLNNQSPYFLLHQSEPDLYTLNVFGSLVFASNLHSHRSKLDLRARKCIFLSYKPGVKGVVSFDILKKSILLSRDVTHHETIFPYQSSLPKVPWDYHTFTPLDNDPIPILPPDNDTTPDNDPTPNHGFDPSPSSLSISLSLSLSLSLHLLFLPLLTRMSHLYPLVPDLSDKEGHHYICLTMSATHPLHQQNQLLQVLQ